VIAHRQLIELGFSAKAVKHRLRAGRLHPVRRGIYALGRPDVSQDGLWMAAVLACGSTAALSHASAGALWKVRRALRPIPEVSVLIGERSRPAGITLHRRARLEVTTRRGIPVTTITTTLIDLASFLDPRELEAAVNEADKLDLIDPEQLRKRVDGCARRPGLGKLRALLDEHAVQLTDSDLERRFLSLARASGLPRPETQSRHNGFRVDFAWPTLGLIVETDGLRYHRTPAQQARDRVRDQAHTAAGLTPLRFTRAQVANDPERVASILAAVIDRLAR
jgi:very-short-patch-repair endonuclease